MAKKTTRRPSLGANDPLNALLAPESYVPGKPTLRETVQSAARMARAKKVRATFHLSEALFEEVRDAVVALSGPPHRFTLAGFAEAALRDKLAALKKAENKGKAFPKRDGELRGGRPIGS